MMAVAASVPSDPPRTPPQSEPFRPEGLYVHVPFCVSICPYCDFVVYGGSAARGPRSRVDPFVSALIRELELRADAIDGHLGSLDERAWLGSIYLGGGTPSLLSAQQVEHLLDAIRSRFGVAPDAEITLEANPGSDEIGDLHGFRAAGVTRLSIGVQSMAANELSQIGRRHSPADVIAAVQGARSAGFDSVSLDLLTDLPGQSVASWDDTLRQALRLEPDHLSVYALSLDDPDAEGLTGEGGDHLPVSSGARRWRERSRTLQSQDRAAQMDVLTDELASRAGLQRYEIANLARPGHESRHNLLYWKRRPYLALGPGAHASDGLRLRTWNAARLDSYVTALAEGYLPPGGHERVDAVTATAEAAILGLRVSEGIDRELADDERVAPALDWAREHGLVETVGVRTRLTAQGRSLSNEVFMRLLPDHPGDGATEASAGSSLST